MTRMIPSSSSIEMKCSQAALQHIKKKLAEKPDAIGLSIRLKKAGCSGWLYQFDYSSESTPDEVACPLKEGLTVFVPRKHLSWFEGVILDYVTTGFTGSLTCINPNEGMRCGCGESFTLSDNKR